MKSVLSNNLFGSNLEAISGSTMLILLVLFASIFALLYVLKRYIVPLFFRFKDKRENHFILMRLEVIVWLIYTIVTLILLFSESFSVTLGLLLVVGLAGFYFWRNFFPGLLIRVADKFRVDDLVRHKDYTGKLIKLGITTMHIRTADEEEVYIPYKDIINAAFIKRQETGKLMSTKVTFQIEEKNIDTILKAVPNWLFECPWSIPQNENQVELHLNGLLHITIYATDHQSLSRVERFLEKSIEDVQ